ncbi:hypothetical protein [Alloscardovia omnicolens]|uniref:hypothetical protein n=1 Tax=Alloscardovia omnicolens TaxID=419015 RepID=UPI0006652D37|nr:hypothetical protein [Alloscardovia omnicolens]
MNQPQQPVQPAPAQPAPSNPGEIPNPLNTQFNQESAEAFTNFVNTTQSEIKNFSTLAFLNRANLMNLLASAAGVLTLLVMFMPFITIGHILSYSGYDLMRENSSSDTLFVLIFVVVTIVLTVLSYVTKKAGVTLSAGILAILAGIVGGPIGIFDMQQANELGGDFVSNPVGTGFFLYTILGFVILVASVLSVLYWRKNSQATKAAAPVQPVPSIQNPVANVPVQQPVQPVQLAQPVQIIQPTAQPTQQDPNNPNQFGA